jgi:hypothetical protein
MIYKKEIPVKKIDIINKVLNNRYILHSLNKGLWIAGGFARQVGHHLFFTDKNIKDSNESIYSYFYNRKGDIDLFGDSEENILKVARECENLKCDCDLFCMHHVSSSNFSLNLEDDKALKNYKENQSLSLKIQFVDKFTFKNISECFESFDMDNCKYAIVKEKDNFYLYYDNKAIEADALKTLEINHTDSPLLGSRIYKYLTKDNIVNKLSDSTKSKSNFKEYLFKCLTSSWDNNFTFFDSEAFIINTLNKLDNVHKLDPVDIAMFLGKLQTTRIIENTNSDYGVFADIVVVDWATDKLSKCN